MKKNDFRTPGFKLSKWKVQKVFIWALPLFLLLTVACQDDEGINPDIQTNDYLLSLPKVEFPPEMPARLDSSANEQDPEYDYKIDYYSAAAGYNEQIVMDPQTDVIYPGALIKGETILDGRYIPIAVGRKPITISTSLQGSENVSTTVEDPKLSTVREAVNSLMNQEYDVPPANVGFEVKSVYNRAQFDMSFNAGYNSGFAEVHGGFDYSRTHIKSRVVAKFIQKYYTLDMDLPSQPSDLIANAPGTNMYGSLMPMYVSTVTFGRMALFVVESELQETDVHTYLNGSYGTNDAEAEANFNELISKSTMKVYVLGGSGEDASAIINGYSDFKKYVTQGGNYSKTSPGAPISYKLRFINDNAIARVVSAASYPIRTATERTDNIRYDVSVRLMNMQPLFDDPGGHLELWGTIKSYLNNSSSGSRNHWRQLDKNHLSLAKNEVYNFPNNTTTRRTYTNLKAGDYITLYLDINESDLTRDEDLGVGIYTITVKDINGKPNGHYDYNINRYGRNSNFVSVQFDLKIEKTSRL